MHALFNEYIATSEIVPGLTYVITSHSLRTQGRIQDFEMGGEFL